MKGKLLSAIAIALLCAVRGAEAEEPADTSVGYEQFTFKRIGAPTNAARKRITIQIDPDEQARRLAGVLPPPENPIPRGGTAPGLIPVPPGRSGGGDYAWYWDVVSPAIGESPGRFSQALLALTQGPEGAQVGAPRLQHLQDIALLHGREIMRATIGTRVSPALALAVISVESAGRSDAVSHAGAAGLMQLIPATAERFGVADRMDPADNIKGGVAYLDWLMGEFGSDPLMVLAAYNSGENAVRGAGGVPPYAETRNYVPKVLAAWMVARGLCVTPPELVSDGCVFAANG
ncbi:lytic transglycosylase domain-containing protein [Defluviimonas sp. WL0002]|uniref:Lytic transglycosylase domain-containing protein n=1 Tax=Albidovulum marisflavi TaxID=2984159 RepID=A0ABT2ZA89_9RHOB|nr:lytic transglycosylase domain-containing protein [Defluviimonas sp. WL0002]MCV2868039.1 lytic transglycosylase domain-containing protein [Defluviimonas sp. WL0002]